MCLTPRAVAIRALGWRLRVEVGLRRLRGSSFAAGHAIQRFVTVYRGDAGPLSQLSNRLRLPIDQERLDSGEYLW